MFLRNLTFRRAHCLPMGVPGCSLEVSGLIISTWGNILPLQWFLYMKSAPMWILGQRVLLAPNISLRIFQSVCLQKWAYSWRSSTGLGTFVFREELVRDIFFNTT